MGSPHSIHGHVVPGPEFGLGLTPSIVQYNDYGHSEYTFQASGMDDFTLEFNPAKTNANSFVGECKNISTLYTASAWFNFVQFRVFSSLFTFHLIS